MINDSLQSTLPKMTVVLDIDGVLTGHDKVEEDEKLYYIRKSAIIVAAEHEFQVLVGAIELIRYLFSKPYVVVAFFSSGAKIRNDEFVEKLLILALGKERYLQVSSSVRVLNNEDCVRCDKEAGTQMHQLYGLTWGGDKKDIRKALHADADLKNTILVDDDQTNVYCGQERNFLSSPWGHSGDLNFLRTLYHSKEDEYTVEWNLKKRFPIHNSVFFVAGVLDHCLTLHEAGGDVTKFLCNFHFRENTDIFSLFKTKLKPKGEFDESFYERGLSRLKTVNSDITYVTAKDYTACNQTPVTEAEQIQLDQYKTTKIVSFVM